MSIITNIKFANKKMVTGFGVLAFDSTGSTEIPDTKVDYFKKIGFTVKEIPEETNENPLILDETIEEDITTQPEEEKPSLALPEDVDRMNVPQLKKVARGLGVDLKGANKKDEILAILKA